jgi:hypothetical protein
MIEMIMRENVYHENISHAFDKEVNHRKFIFYFEALAGNYLRFRADNDKI